ncbi:MAG: hypothetical protein JOZ69_22495, partial [Myxococcales bacterium]|nr:hypothetical protein [Myxococcales bacterium]
VALVCALSLGLGVPAAARAQPTAPAGAPAAGGGAATRPTSAYVLSLWTDDVDDQADALTEALRARVRQSAGWSLPETTQSFETLAIALKCPPRPDPACLQRIGEQLHADHYFWGTMQKRAGAPEVVAEVHLWTRGKPDAVVREAYADAWKDPNAEPLRAVAATILATLTGAAVPPPPRQAVPRPEDGNELPGSGPPAPPGAPPPPVADRGVQTRTLLGYSALVLGGGFLVAAGIEAANWVSDNNASEADRKSVPSTVTDVCAMPVNGAAQDACNKSRDASNVSTLGWIFAGVGTALVGAGTVLLVSGTAQSDAPAETTARAARGPKVDWVPAVGPRGAQMGVRVTF